MDVKLYVYDLTKGMARSMSRQFLGIQIDAVYHTAVVFNNVEYFFGAGVQTCYPGATHHGQPMEIIPLGTTHLPADTIMEYLESLKEVYTPESYDLFAHNCNNFSNDFAMFLVGKGIPDHITSLPRRVLETPFGQMLKPQLDASMRNITQAPIPAQNVPTASRANGISNGSPTSNGHPSIPTSSNSTLPGVPVPYGRVYNLTSSNALEKQLKTASNACATIFFTSSTCAPCKMAYPAFDSLSEQYPQALFVKVDINEARDVASTYQIRATPTFMTFSKGGKLDEWTGADPRLLTANTERLIKTTWPPHPHTQVRLPTLQFGSLKAVTYAKVPPLDKLTAKLGSAASEPAVQALKSFVEHRQKEGAREAPLPDLQVCSVFMQSAPKRLPPEVLFAAYDLLRCSVTDARCSGWFAEDSSATIYSLLQHVNELQDCPHNLRLVTIHLACNMFSSPLFVNELFTANTAGAIVQLVATSLLDASHTATRIAAASLAFNLSVSNYRIRREEQREALAEADAVELAASLVETLSLEENKDAVKGILLAFGYLVYCAPHDGEIMDLCKALDAKGTVEACKGKGEDKVVLEVASLLK